MAGDDHRTFGAYDIQREVGRGGMGVVYLATDRRLGRRVALKVIVPELAADAQFRQRFEREARVAATLEHPHVVPVYEAGEQDGSLFIAMRFIDGRDLATEVRDHGRSRPIAWLGSSCRWPARSTRRTAPASCTATSSPPTSCSREPARTSRPTSPTSASRARPRPRAA